MEFGTQEFSSMTFLLYGANGYTGSLIAHECAAHGLRPVLAGRSEAKVRPLAEKLGFDWRIANLNDSAAVNRMLHDMPLVLHCAGPFSVTSRPMANGCLQTHTHYLDLTGEISTLEALQQCDAEARAAGVMLLPGVGFDIVPTDCTAAILKQHLPDATSLRLAILGVGSLSHGTMKTLIENMNSGGLVRRNGLLLRVPSGWKTRDIDYGGTTAASITIPLGDVFAAWYSTGVPDIETYVAVPGFARLALRLGRYAGPLLGTRPVQHLLKRLASLLPEGPDEKERNRTHSCVWGEARNDSGQSRTALLHTPNVYTLTALAALASVQRVLAGTAPAGFQTPSLAFGAEFATTISGVKLTIADHPL